jgi:hypothetical protein
VPTRPSPAHQAQAARGADLDLVTVLLVVAALELALNRLAVPVLRPAGVTPPWHRDLDVVGLFVFHLATALAFGVGVWKTLALVFQPARIAALPRALILAAAGLFFGLAAWGVIVDAPPQLSFHLESCFTLVLLLLGMGLALRPGDPLVKLGLVVLTVPFLLHYYGTFALRLLIGDARGSSLPDRVRELGQWSIAAAAIGVSLCFAPRPLGRALGRLGPAALAGFVGTVLTVVMVRHQDVGLEIASRGLGIDFGPGVPVPEIVAFVVAAMATTWLLASVWTDESAARRHLGTGFALVCIGGYGFAWPLTLLTVVAGALVIVDAGAELPAAGAATAQPGVPERALLAYGAALASELGGQAAIEGGALVAQGSGWRVVVAPQPAAVDVTLGKPGDTAAPAWTLEARPDHLLGGHPHAPLCAGPLARTDDPAFDQRFRVHDAGGLTERLFDAGLRARAAAALDGWVAVWPGPDGGLRYRVEPGRGAPLDHPLPLSALRRGDTSDARRLAAVVELLAEVAQRAAAC